jgi:hypothetical protein
LTIKLPALLVQHVPENRYPLRRSNQLETADPQRHQLERDKWRSRELLITPDIFIVVQNSPQLENKPIPVDLATSHGRPEARAVRIARAETNNLVDPGSN